MEKSKTNTRFFNEGRAGMDLGQRVGRMILAVSL